MGVVGVLLRAINRYSLWDANGQLELRAFQIIFL